MYQTTTRSSEWVELFTRSGRLRHRRTLLCSRLHKNDFRKMTHDVMKMLRWQTDEFLSRPSQINVVVNSHVVQQEALSSLVEPLETNELKHQNKS